MNEKEFITSAFVTPVLLAGTDTPKSPIVVPGSGGFVVNSVKPEKPMRVTLPDGTTVLTDSHGNIID